MENLFMGEPIIYRQLSDHQVNYANDRLKVEVTDEPGAGGASHRYEITGFDVAPNPSYNMGTIAGFNRHVILFQNGPITSPQDQPNGLTHEVLLAIIADRLRSFQAGPFACDENDGALANIEEAMRYLNQRTEKRRSRGVEGTLEP